jgi:hypothetical protein
LSDAQGDVTQLLAQWTQGDRAALDAATRAVYAELHKIAKGYFRRERSQPMLQPTALIHEAWLRPAKEEHVSFENRQICEAAIGPQKRACVRRAHLAVLDSQQTESILSSMLPYRTARRAAFWTAGSTARSSWRMVEGTRANRHGFIVEAMLTQADGTAEADAAILMADAMRKEKARPALHIGS